MINTTGNTALDGLIASDNAWMTLHEVYRTQVTRRSGLLKTKHTSAEETHRTGRHICRSDFLDRRVLRVADQAITAAVSLSDCPAVDGADAPTARVNINRILFHFIDSLLVIEVADRRGEDCGGLLHSIEAVADEFATAVGKVVDLPALSIPLPTLDAEETLPQLTATLAATVAYNAVDKGVSHG